jgi:uncharacterized protein YecT (DUF1311 family)
LFSTDAEKLRRQKNAAYQTALGALRATRKRTTCIEEYVDHIRVWQDVKELLWQELLDILRRLHRFFRFQATQRALVELAKWMIGDNAGKSILFFGNMHRMSDVIEALQERDKKLHKTIEDFITSLKRREKRQEARDKAQKARQEARDMALFLRAL